MRRNLISFISLGLSCFRISLKKSVTSAILMHNLTLMKNTIHLALKKISANILKVVSAKEDLWNKEKCFLFHFESSFLSWDNQILNFQIFKCHDVIKCLNMKHDTYFIEWIGKQTQPGNWIWPVYVTLQDNLS